MSDTSPEVVAERVETLRRDHDLLRHNHEALVRRVETGTVSVREHDALAARVAEAPQVYLTKTEFNALVDPIRKLVYGTVAILLTGIVAAVLTLVLRQ